MPKRATKPTEPTLDFIIETLWVVELEKRRTDPIQAAVIAAARQRVEWDRAQLVINTQRIRGELKANKDRVFLDKRG